MKYTTTLAMLLAVAASGALAQHKPYSAHETRDIKALSADEVKQYLAGDGMGYALPAELNRYPGPMHVLELADKLSLSDAQRAQTQALMQAHKTEARAIGAKLVASERELETLFRDARADRALLAAAVRTAAELRGEYRLSHLETHRRMRALLSEDQIRRYDQLRGYTAGAHNDALPGSGHRGHRH